MWIARCGARGGQDHAVVQAKLDSREGVQLWLVDRAATTMDGGLVSRRSGGSEQRLPRKCTGARPEASGARGPVHGCGARQVRRLGFCLCPLDGKGLDLTHREESLQQMDGRVARRWPDTLWRPRTDCARCQDRPGFDRDRRWLPLRAISAAARLAQVAARSSISPLTRR